MSFPRLDCTLRTDERFRQQIDEEHHRCVTPLVDLPIDLVEDFVVADPLHLLELGVMKRCLKGWVRGDFNFKSKFSGNDINRLSELLLECNKLMPKELHRAVRSIKYLTYWKGLEYRTFLLYLGMVVLKDILSEDIYLHFLKLVCAVTICSCKEYEENLDLANILFREYVEEYITLYGVDSISSNVHNLIHIVPDVKKFGILNSISTYPFENCLGQIKNLLRQGNLPLEQVARRMVEREVLVDPEITMSKYPLINEKSKKKDRCFMTIDHEIIEIVSQTDNSLIIGKSVKDLRNFFVQPFSSSNINIFVATGEKNDPKPYQITSIKCKMISLPYHNKQVFMPLLHTLDSSNSTILGIKTVYCDKHSRKKSTFN